MTPRVVRTILPTAAAAALALSAPGAAQESIADGYRIPLPPSVEASARGSLAAPAIAIGVPTGFGADGGDVFLGIGAQSRTRYADKPDGGAVLGIGLGDARKLIGLEVAVSQYGTLRSCCRGGVSFKAHRIFPGALGVAVGWENATGWGHVPGSGDGPFTDAGSAVYGAVSKVFFLSPHGPSAYRNVTATVGVGSGRFRSESDVLADNETANVFGSLGVRLWEPFSVVGSWTGQDLNAGVSVVPLPRVPLAVTVAAADLTTEPRLVAGLGIGFSPF